MEKAFLKKLTEITEANISNPSFGVNELAREMGMSYSSLRRRYYSLTGKAAKQFIREIRLRRAWELLNDEEQALTAAEVAFRTGFSSPTYFTTSFHDFFGYPPGEVKKVKGVEGMAGSRNGQYRERALSMTKDEGDMKHPEKKRRTGQVVFAASTGFLILLFFVIFFSIISPSEKAASDPMRSREITIAVLPFENRGAGDNGDNLCKGFRDNLIASLSEVGGFIVRSEILPGSVLNSDNESHEIGQKYDVEYLITGSIALESNKLHFMFKLIESKTNRVVVTDMPVREFREILTLQDELTRKFARKLNAKLIPLDTIPGEPPPTRNKEAWKYYQTGQTWLKATRSDLAYDCFNLAVNLDTKFIKAYLGIANALTHQFGIGADRSVATLNLRKQAVDKVLQLEPGNNDALMAMISYYQDTGDLEKALEQCEKVLKKNPQSPAAISRKGLIYRSLGHWDKAIEYFTQAVELAPRSSGLNEVLATACEMTRDYPKAVKHYSIASESAPGRNIEPAFLSDIAVKWEGDLDKARKILEEFEKKNEIDPYDMARFNYRYVWLDLFEGHYKKALDHLGRAGVLFIDNMHPRALVYATIYGFMKKPDLEKAYYDSSRLFLEKRQLDYPELRKDPRVTGALGITYAGLGNQDKAIQLGRAAAEDRPESGWSKLRPYSVEDLAYIYVLTGKYPEALKLLDELLSRPGPLTSKLLDMDPRWKPLKIFPEFKTLLEKYPVK